MMVGIENLLYGIRIIIIGVLMEGMDDLIGSRTDQHEIEMGEVIVLSEIIIVVGDIGVGNEWNVVVRNKGFIMDGVIDWV